MNYELLNKIILGNTVKSYLLFAIILLVGLPFKRLFSKLLSKLIFKLFGRFGDVKHPHVFVTLLVHPVELLILFAVLYFAINQLSFPLNEVIFTRKTTVNNIASTYNVTLIDVIDKVFLFLFIISIFWIILRIIDFVAHVFLDQASLTESKSENQIIPFIKELSKIVTIIIGVFVLMGAVFNLNVATIIAGLGIGGIAVALAAQDTLQNLLGSFTIFADKPFVVGDLVRIDKYEGTIEKVGFRSTLIRTLDKTVVIIPNKKMIDSPLENLTLRNLRRIKFNLGLKYETPADTMLKISKDIEEFVNKHSATSNDTSVTFESFGDSSLNLQVIYFIKIDDYNNYMKIREEINYQIMEIVAKNGASFSSPPQTIYQPYPTEKK